ncbi:kinesin-like protein KIF11, partial [Stegodyphus dumicola]|uniref:kinesin-like protein KIF11 n=1 Tax=Stegodyphus dumicola TaxID=202533 RepID=UPI0015A9381B
MNKKKKNNEAIQVFVRCRPLLENEKSLPMPVEVHPEVNKIFVKDILSGAVRTFTFDKVFASDAGQDQVYKEVAAPVIQDVLMGFNCTIFAYGQTGTGKTFTMEGERSPDLESGAENDPLPGIIPRAMRHIFNKLEEQKNFDIAVSFLELYNEDIFDLLSSTDDLNKLKLFDTTHKGSVVQGLTVRNVTSMDDIYSILDKGCKKRRKAATLLNKMSSRSHTIFTVTVKTKECYSTIERTKIGKLNLVDLAGSENIGRSGAIEKRAREAGNINQSLLALGRVITSLSENAQHIPYRESKLTRLLKDSLGGTTKTAIIATISPSVANTEETLNTLEYTLRAKNIMIKPAISAQVLLKNLNKEYLDKIRRLKSEIQVLSSTTPFMVNPKNLERLQRQLAEKRNANYAEMAAIEEMYKEAESLDKAIIEAEATLYEENTKLEEEKKLQEELTTLVQKESDSLRFSEKVHAVLQLVSSNLHERYHKEIKMKMSVEAELGKVKEKESEAMNEHKQLIDKLQNIRRIQNNTTRGLRNFTDNFLKRVDAAHSNVISLTNECQNWIASLQAGLDCVSCTCDKEFEELSAVIANLQKARETFHAELISIFNEEKLKKESALSDFKKAYSEVISICNFEPINQILTACEKQIQTISASIKECWSELTLKVEDRVKMVNRFCEDQELSLSSLSETLCHMIEKQKLSLEIYEGIILEAVTQDTEIKKKWENQMNIAENALSELMFVFEECCAKELETSNRAQAAFEELADVAKDVSDKLVSYSDNSINTTDVLQEEISLPVSDSSFENVQSMRENINDVIAKYNRLAPEFSKCGDLQNIDEFCKEMEKKLLDSENEAHEQLEVTACIKDFTDSLAKNKEFCESLSKEYEQKRQTFESEEKALQEELKNSSKCLVEALSVGISEHISHIENDETSKYLHACAPTSESIEAQSDSDQTSEDKKNSEIKTPLLLKSAVEFKESLADTGENKCSFCSEKFGEQLTQTDSISSECIPNVNSEKSHSGKSKPRRSVLAPTRESSTLSKSPVVTKQNKATSKKKILMSAVQQLCFEMMNE